MVSGDWPGLFHVVESFSFIFLLAAHCLYCLVLLFFIYLFFFYQSCFTVKTLDCELRNGPVFSVCLLRCLGQVAGGFVALVIFHVLILKWASSWASACPVTSSEVIIDLIGLLSLIGSYLWREATATWCIGVNLNGGNLTIFLSVIKKLHYECFPASLVDVICQAIPYLAC